jgi:hypothetical protein
MKEKKIINKIGDIVFQRLNHAIYYEWTRQHWETESFLFIYWIKLLVTKFLEVFRGQFGSYRNTILGLLFFLAIALNVANLN